MTAITLPLKKIPGQSTQLPTFFGGRKITAPIILLLTIPFNIYLYLQLNQGAVLTLNLIGFLPYFWGLISIIFYLTESSRRIDLMLEADLVEAEKIHQESKVEFRTILVSNIILSVLMMAVFSYLLVAYGILHLFIIGVSSITSVGIAVASIISGYELGAALTYIFVLFTFEAASIFMALRGQWAFNVVFSLISVMFVYSCLLQVEKYDLRSFFERVIN